MEKVNNKEGNPINLFKGRKMSGSIKVTALIWSYGQIREKFIAVKKNTSEGNVVTRNYDEAEKVMEQLKARQEEMLNFWKGTGEESLKLENPKNLSDFEDPGIYA